MNNIYIYIYITEGETQLKIINVIVKSLLGNLRIRHVQMEGRKEMFYLTTHSTYFIYGYMVSNIW